MKSCAIVIVTCGLAVGGVSVSRAGPGELKVISQAAEALGGRDKVMGVKTLGIIGYGQAAYQDGGGNIASTPDAPQKWININAHQRTIDFENGRMNVRQRNVQNFVFALLPNMTGAVRVNQSLDGDIAFDATADGKVTRQPATTVRARRIEMLNNPVAIVRAALDPATRLGGLRRQGPLQLVDIATQQGDHLTLAIDMNTHLPAWLSWVAPHANFGDVTYQTRFSGYQRVNGGGLNLPSGYNTISDFRNVMQRSLYVDKYEVDVPADSLAAPADVRAAAVPVPPRPTVEAIPVTRGIWYLNLPPAESNGNSILFEFDDHLVVYELYDSEEVALAVIEKARATVPGKPLTHVILSHHHIDHTGGLRTAVAEGLTVITNRQNVDYVREVTSRPAKVFPDALGRNPRRATIIPVDDHLKLKDTSMEIDLYRTVNNSHYAHGLIAYVPRDRFLVQGDLVSERWSLGWWGNGYPDTVKYWNLQVDKDLPVHGSIHTYAEVLAYLKQQAANAQKLCAAAAAASLSVQGCPVSNTLEGL